MNLPLDIIVMIGSQLDHSSMLHLSLSSRSVYEALEKVLKAEKSVRECYRSIDLSDMFPPPFSYHELLKCIAQDDRLSEYIVSLTCDEGFYFDGHDDMEYRAKGVAQFNAGSRRLLEKRLKGLGWISEQYLGRLLNRGLIAGLESAMLAMILCFLVELRCLRPPLPWGSDVQELVETFSTFGECEVSKAQTLRKKSLDTGGQPLQKLSVFVGNTSNGVHGTGLEDARVWMGLPSVRRVILNRCRTSYIKSKRMPVMPVIRAPDIYLPDSSVTLEAIAEFADSLQAPCVIRQSYGHGGEYSDLGPPRWDHCEVFEDRDGVRDVKIEFRYPDSDQHNQDHRDVEPDWEGPKFMGSPAWIATGSEHRQGDIHDWNL